GLKSMENPLEFGIVITREDGSIDRFLEKPTWGQVFSDTINTGIYVLEPRIFDYIPEGTPYDFSSDVFPALLEANESLYGFQCEEGVVLGDECFVGEHAVINPGVKVYPFKTVEPGAIINSSIVWESRGARHLFGRDGISGLANVDITPELAVRVAMAYGTTLKKGSTVTT